MKLRAPSLLLILVLAGLPAGAPGQEAPARRHVREDASVATPRVIGEGGGARLWLYSTFDGESVRQTYDHLLVAEAPDKRRFELYHASTPSPDPAARMNARGDVAVPYFPGVKIFLAPDYKPVEVRKLRGDRFLKAAPALHDFGLRDLTWGEGVLVCSGEISVSNNPAKPDDYPTVEYPFVSRLIFDAKGEVRDHQILWTIWNPGLAAQIKDPHPSRYYPADVIPGSLHLQGELALWKNEGQPEGNYPPELSPDFKKSAWQCTDMATGQTRLLIADDKVDRERLAEIDKKLEAVNPRRPAQ